MASEHLESLNDFSGCATSIYAILLQVSHELLAGKEIVEIDMIVLFCSGSVRDLMTHAPRPFSGEEPLSV